MKQNVPHQVRCLRAVEAYVGGRKALAEELGLSKSAIDRWVRTGEIAANKMVRLVSLSDHRFKLEDFFATED